MACLRITFALLGCLRSPPDTVPFPSKKQTPIRLARVSESCLPFKSRAKGRQNQGAQHEAHAASRALGGNTAVTNCHPFLKYGGMTHHLTHHRWKTQGTESRTAELRGPRGKGERTGPGRDRGTSRAQTAGPRPPGVSGRPRVTSCGSWGAGGARASRAERPGFPSPAGRGSGGDGAALPRGLRRRAAGRARRQVRTAGGSGVRAGADPGKEEGGGPVPRGEGGARRARRRPTWR